MGADDKKKILHVVGSPSDEYNFCNNFLYAAACHPGEEFVFCFAVVFPDGKWSFLSTLKEAALEQEKKVNTDEAAARIIAWSPDAIHSHLFCVRGQTIYRGLLFALGFPMIGSTPTTYGICKDKGLTRGALSGHKLLAKGLVVKRWNTESQLARWSSEGDFPCIVKSADLDDSLGLSRVDRKEHLESAVEQCFKVGAGSVIVEKFIKGKEYRVGVIETGPEEYMMLPVMDYMMEEEQVRDLEYKLDLNNRGIPTGKSAKNRSRFLDLSNAGPLKKKLEKLTFSAFQTLELHDFALFDIRVDADGDPWLLEIGLFCSFSKNSVLNIMAQECNISPPQLLSMMANNAIKRHQINKAVYTA